MMASKVDLKSVYKRSEDVVAREIEDEFLLVPIASSIGDMEDALYTLNETGREIWQRLDGNKTVNDIVEELGSEFDAEKSEIRKDVSGLLAELTRLNMVEVSE